MTIIDTTLYANGALRLSRHGSGRGGNVLMLVYEGGGTEQLDIPDGCDGPLMWLERDIKVVGPALAFITAGAYVSEWLKLHP